MNQTCNIVELFSGIGSQAKALKNLGYKVNTLLIKFLSGLLQTFVILLCTAKEVRIWHR